MILFLSGGASVYAAGTAFFGLVNLVFLVPLYLRKKPALSDGPIYRLLLANVYQPNCAYDRVVALIGANKPHFVILVETNPNWLDGLESLRQEYPYVYSALREDCYGLTLMISISY